METKEKNVSITELPLFRTQWDLNDPAIGCPVIGVSLTVPDESYSIRDILTKFTRMPDVMDNNLVYDFDGEQEDFDFDQEVITSFGDLTDFDMMSDRVKNLTAYLDDEKARVQHQARDDKKAPSTNKAGSEDVPLV